MQGNLIPVHVEQSKILDQQGQGEPIRLRLFELNVYFVCILIEFYTFSNNSKSVFIYLELLVTHP